MSIGPVFECPSSLVSGLPLLASSIAVDVDVLHDVEANGWVGRYVFRTRFATIIGRQHNHNNVIRMWLHFSWKHAFNPFHWPADFRLLTNIERLLRENGAHSCDWDF